MKKWRRSGRRSGSLGTVGPALQLDFLAPATWSSTPNEAFLATPAATAQWQFSVNGAAFATWDTTAWPFAGNVFEWSEEPGLTMQTRVVLNTGPVVTSNLVVLP